MYSNFGGINHGNNFGGNFTPQVPFNGFNTVPYGFNTVPFNPFQTWNQMPVQCQPNLGFWNGMNTMPLNTNFVPTPFGTNLNHPYVNYMPTNTFGTTPVPYGMWNNTTMGHTPGICNPGGCF